MTLVHFVGGEQTAGGKDGAWDEINRDEKTMMIEGEEQGDSQHGLPYEDGANHKTWERIDSVCDRFEEQWINGEPPGIESFLPSESNTERELTFRELLKLDLDYRWRQGLERFSVEHYASRFPEYRSIIVEEFDRQAKTQVGGTTLGVMCEEERAVVAWFFAQFEGGPVAAQHASSGDLRGSELVGSAAVRKGTSLPQQLADLLRVDDTELFKSRFLRRLRLWSEWHGGDSRIGNEGERAGARSDAWIRYESKSLPRAFGEYELFKVAGHGGMGVVYEANHLPTGRQVAIKLVRRDRLEHRHREEIALALSRFEQEARAAAGIDHEHWVRVYDVGEFDGQPYYSMQFVDGPSLAALLQQGPLEGERAAGYLEPVARALAVAHRHRILHRDLKPHNILIRRDVDHALITDFGLAKLLDNNQGDTCTGDAFGSPSYISPEQAMDASRVDERSDIYGLGATLYHAITGRSPFQASSIGRVIDQVMRSEPVEPRQLNPHVDRDLETICLKCLAKDPNRRFASATELADELRRFLERRPIRSRPISRWERGRRWTQRNPLPAALGGGVIMLLTLLVVGGTIAGFFGRATLRRTKEALTQERQAKLELTEALIENVELVAAEPLLSEVRFRPLRQRLLQGASTRLDQFLIEPTRDDQDRSRVTQIWSSIAEVEFRAGVMSESKKAAEAGLAVLMQFDHPWSPIDTLAYFDLQLRLAAIEWETLQGEDALERLDQLAESEALSTLALVQQAKVRIRADLQAVDIQLACAEIDEARQRLNNMQEELKLVPRDDSLEYVMLTSNVYERESLIDRQRTEIEPTIVAARRAVQEWGLPETESLEELTAACRAKFGIDFPPPDFFRQVLNQMSVEWPKRTPGVSRRNLEMISLALDQMGDSIAIRNVLTSTILLRSRLASADSDFIASESMELLSRYGAGQREDHCRSGLLARLKLSAVCANVIREGKDSDQALSMLNDVVKELRRSRISPRDEELIVALSATEFALSQALRMSGDLSNAIIYEHASIDRLRTAVRSPHTGILAANQIARLLAYIDSRGDETKGLNGHLGIANSEADSLLEQLSSRYPGSAIIRMELAVRRVRQLMAAKPINESRLEIENELANIQRIAASARHTALQRTLGQTLLDLTAFFSNSGDHDAALELSERAISVHQQLVALEPDVLDHRLRLGTSFCIRAAILLRKSDSVRALVHYRRADAEFYLATRDSIFLSGITTPQLGQWLVAKIFQYRLSNTPSFRQLVDAFEIHQASIRSGHNAAELQVVYRRILQELEQVACAGLLEASVEVQVLDELLRYETNQIRRTEVESRRDRALVRLHMDGLEDKRRVYLREVANGLPKLLKPWWRGVRRRVLGLLKTLDSTLAGWLDILPNWQPRASLN